MSQVKITVLVFISCVVSVGPLKINGNETNNLNTFNTNSNQDSICSNIYTPQSSNGLSFSHTSGFYSDTFDITISTSEPEGVIIYTLDGSNPQNSATAITAGTSVTVHIDPESNSHRATTPAFIIRASIKIGANTPSVPTARTFIFLDKVKEQSYPGNGWPQLQVNDQIIDLPMDPDVVNSRYFKDQIDDALLDLPSISIITDNANLFDRTRGIYVNAYQEGVNWERECSVELIYPDGQQGFNVNAGIRIRGRASRSGWVPKHAFRLFFREKYGNNKLYYPLFEDEGVAEFDKIDLRCAQNYAWSNSSPEHNTFVRDVFARDSQKSSGQPYTRSRYYHLYLNGMYWGLYQTQERSEARYSESYIGGDKEDYDVIKIQGGNSFNLIATDGNMNKWSEVHQLARKGFGANKNYFFLEGKDANGQHIRNGEVLVDIDNLIDYMINIFFTGNFDSPVTKWDGNVLPNNMYAITNRNNRASGFKFYVHDAEHTLMLGATSGSPGVGLYENRVSIYNGGGHSDPSLSYFHTQWLHHKLTANTEYRVRFADRAYKHLNNNGIFTPEECLQRLNNRVAQINLAIIAESARWGDACVWDPQTYTRNNAWLPEINQIRNNYLPHRTGILKDQLSMANLYPKVEGPILKDGSSNVLETITHIENSISVTMETPTGNGEIVYTVNGIDPRNIGGSVASSSISVVSGTNINISGSSLIKARVLSNNEWSAIKEYSFIKEQTDYSNLKVTEIHYHPRDSVYGNDTVSGKSYEFIEFKNIDSVYSINLTGLKLDSAIYYEFPDGYILPPKQHFVVASKPYWFSSRYGLAPSGNFSKNLSNGGEQIVLINSSGEAIMDFYYDDEPPWPESPDGDGPSLVSVEINPTGEPGLYTYWKESETFDGTPFYSGDNLTGIFNNPLSAEHLNVEVFPNLTTDVVHLSVPGNNSDAVAKLYNLNGSLVTFIRFNTSTSISLSDLNIPHGLYFIKVKANNRVQTKKVIYNP